jgi:hypothetical protein
MQNWACHTTPHQITEQYRDTKTECVNGKAKVVHVQARKTYRARKDKAPFSLNLGTGRR